MATTPRSAHSGDFPYAMIDDEHTDSLPYIDGTETCKKEVKADPDAIKAHCQLIRAVKKNNLDDLQALLKSGARMDLTEHSDMCLLSPLDIACTNNNLAAIRILLDFHSPCQIPLLFQKKSLECAIKIGNYQCLQLLLKSGFDVNATDDYKITALHNSILSEKVDAVKILLDAGADIHQKTVFGEEAIFFTAVNDDTACLDLLLDRKADIHSTNKDGDTVLHTAATYGSIKQTIHMLEHGADLWRPNPRGVKPIDQIRRRTLQAYLDTFVTLPPATSENQEPMARVNFKILDPSPQGKAEFRRLKYFMWSERQRILLKHPVLASFVYLKWKRCFPFFLCNFLIYFSFVVSSSVYALSFMPPVNASRPVDMRSLLESPETNQVLHHVVMAFLVLLMCRELYQLSTARLYYFLTVENYMEIAIIVTAGVVVFFEKIPLYIERGCVILWPLLTWVELAFLIGRFPTFTKYIAMFTTVSKNYLRFLFPFSFIIAGFVLSFYLAFNFCLPDTCGDTYQHFPMAAVKTVVMMMGELDLGDLPYGELLPFTLILILIFVFLIMLVLMNLLDALAVSDTQKIADEAELYGLVPLVNLICHVEGTFYKPNLMAILARCCSWCGDLPECCQVLRRHLFEFLLVLPRIHDCTITVSLRTGTVQDVGLTLPEDVVTGIKDLIERKKQTEEEGQMAKDITFIKQEVKKLDALGDDLRNEIRAVNDKVEARGKQVEEVLQIIKDYFSIESRV